MKSLAIFTALSAMSLFTIPPITREYEALFNFNTPAPTSIAVTLPAPSPAPVNPTTSPTTTVKVAAPKPKPAAPKPVAAKPVAALTTVATAPVNATPPAPTTPTIAGVPKTFFGMHIHNNNADVPWPSVPIGAIRLHDTRTTWAWLEPEDNEWDFERLDMFVNQAVAHGAEIMYTLGQAPKWAAARPNDPTMYGPDTSGSEPKNMEVWKDYIATLATRYKGKIKYYEIWNEPNYRPFYTGDIKTMVEMTRVAKETLANIDPNAKVVSPAATTADDGEAWLDSYLALGGNKYIDIVAFHFYVYTPEEIPALAQKIKGIMNKHGVGSKPLWNTESGWCIQNKPGTRAVEIGGVCSTASDVLTPDVAASYIARSMVLAKASGISRFFWYAWDDENMGLVESDNRTLKTPANALTAVQKWLTRGSLKTCGADTVGIWHCELTTTNATEHILWKPNTASTYNIPTTWEVSYMTQLSGTAKTVSSGSNITIGIVPTLVQP